MARQAGADTRIGTQKENKRKGQEELGQSLQILYLQPKETSHLTHGSSRSSVKRPSLLCSIVSWPPIALFPSTPPWHSLKAGSISTLFSYALWVQPPSQCEPFLLIWLVSHSLKSIPPASMQLSVSLNESLLQSHRLISISSEVKRWSSLIGN